MDDVVVKKKKLREKFSLWHMFYLPLPLRQFLLNVCKEKNTLGIIELEEIVPFLVIFAIFGA